MEKNMQLTDLQKTYCLGMHPASFLGGKAHGETAKEKQHKAATLRLPLRTD